MRRSLALKLVCIAGLTAFDAMPPYRVPPPFTGFAKCETNEDPKELLFSAPLLPSDLP